MKLNVFRSGWMSVALVAAGIPLALVALQLASGIYDFVGSAATSVFAMTLIVSLVCNSLIALAWRRYRPRLQVAPFAVPLVQGVLLIAEVVWLIAIHHDDVLVGLPAAVVIMCLSITVFAMIVVPDTREYDREAALRSTPHPSPRA